jgi:hypothetical protein
LLAACNSIANTPTIGASWTLEPSPPTTTHSTRAVLSLHDADGTPLGGATLRIEAHMAHPGMTPVVVDARELAPGVYEAAVQFTMAGPWTLVASGVLSDGRRVTERFDVPGVH